jgi:hypothetical protein
MKITHLSFCNALNKAQDTRPPENGARAGKVSRPPAG